MTREERIRLWNLITPIYGGNPEGHYLDFTKENRTFRINLYVRDVEIRRYGGDILVSEITEGNESAEQFFDRPHRVITFANRTPEECVKLIKDFVDGQ